VTLFFDLNFRPAIMTTISTIVETLVSARVGEYGVFTLLSPLLEMASSPRKFSLQRRLLLETKLGFLVSLQIDT